MMTRWTILIAFLALLDLTACNQTATQDRQAILIDSSSDKFVEKYLSDTSSQTTASKSDSKCYIDTFAILTNKNLQPLIDKLEKNNLTTYKTVKEIPDFLMNFLKCTKDSGQFSIANPGED